MQFEMIKLPYTYDALEPVMDAQTVEIHYAKHHQTYLNNLNAAMEGVPFSGTLEELLTQLTQLPSAIQTTVKNNGGGVYNHNIFWSSLTPQKGTMPTGAFLSAIEQTFGSVQALQTVMEDAGKKQFGSGWVWLILTPQKTLKVVTTANQDTPLKEGEILLGIDVWEHAYYLKHQNRRADYLHQIWQIINWENAQNRFLGK